MPLSYTEVVAAGDPLPNDRHVLSFPTISGVIEGKGLTLRHTTVALPPINTAQIIVPQLGWNLAFAGLRMHENQFNVEFVETTGAPVIKSLVRWADICAGFKTHIAKMKADYAVNCECKAYDSAGESALIVKLYNVWPMNITYGQFSEQSEAAHVSVTFSVDCIDIVDVVYTEQDFQRSIPTSKPQPDLWYESRSGSRFSSGSASNFNMFDSVLQRLGVGTTDIQSVLGRYF